MENWKTENGKWKIKPNWNWAASDRDTSRNKEIEQLQTQWKDGCVSLYVAMKREREREREKDRKDWKDWKNWKKERKKNHKYRTRRTRSKSVE